VMIVLLNVDWTCATPATPTFRSRFFFGFGVAVASATLLPFLVSRGYFAAGFGAGFATVFRIAPAVFFGPLRVRAFVRVR